MINGIQPLLHEDPSLLLDKFGEWLALYYDQPISTTALHDNLRDLSFTREHLKRAAAERDNALAHKLDSGPLPLQLRPHPLTRSAFACC